MRQTARVATTKVGRNDACPCGSGAKYKHCCEGKDPRDLPFLGAAQASDPGAARSVSALSRAAREHWEAGRWVEANSLYREIVKLSPSKPQAHHDLGITFLRLGMLAEAAGSLQKAIDLRPSFESALTHLAYVQEELGQEDDALSIYRRLSRSVEGVAQRRYYMAKVLTMEGRREEAEIELRRVVVIEPGFASARVLLGWLLAERGHFDEAAQQLTDAIDVSPSAFQQLCAVKRMTEADRTLVTRMSHLAQRPEIDVLTRVSIHFGLGKSYDDLGDYRQAIEHYDEANRLKAQSSRLDRAALVARYDNVIARFAPALAEVQHSSSAFTGSEGDLPVFIVGMPRSGTTLVEQILSSHPAVTAAGELTFWQRRIDRADAMSTIVADAATRSRVAAEYISKLRSIGPQALRVTDKAHFNFESLGLLHSMFPDARIVHCRRHPIDTCLSIFFTNFTKRQDYSWNRGDIAFFYRQYLRLMDYWRSVLPAERFIEVEYETLVRDRETETRRLISFIGLDWDDLCLAPERNGRSVKTASLWQARQPVYTTSTERWRRYEPWLGELSELTAGLEGKTAASSRP
jgi:tetratricopeptide (TPR) repeat protein